MVYDGNAIGELPDADFRLYPNPTSGVLTVLSAQGRLAGSFRVKDIAGRSIPLVGTDQPSQTIQLNITGHPPGLYLLRYLDRTGLSWSAPVVKE